MNLAVKITAAALALSLALPACAQTAAPTPAATADADPALWVVKDKDTTVYLFGTIHVLRPGLTWFDEAVKTAFDRSQTLVLEMVEPDTATEQQVVAAKAFAPAGPALTAQLPAPYAEKIAGYMAKGGIEPAVYDRMRPWYAALVLSLLPVQTAGYDAANGPEGILSAAARKSGKDVRGLETFEGQLSIFDNLSQGAELQLLKSTVDEIPGAAAQMERMVSDWSRGDPDALAKEMNDSLKDSPEVAATLLTNRNKHWAAWIAERMRSPGTVFIAVGAGHLAGPESVQNQLKAYRLAAMRVKY